MLASILGGIASGVGNILAGDAQAKAANKARAFNERVYRQGVKRLDPYVQAGNKSINPYLNAIGLGDSQAAISNFQNSPNYLLNFQTGLNSANNQLMRQAAAGGSINSGRTLMGLQDRGMQQANMGYRNYLADIAGMMDAGRQAASGTNSFAMQQGNQITNDMYNRGNALGAQYMGVGNSINNAAGDYVQQQNLNKMLGGSTSAYGGFF